MRREEAALKQLSGNMLQCRWLRHQWVADGFFNGAGRTTVALTHCIRCRAIKEQYIDSAGNIRRVQYHYPSHYLITGSGKLQAQSIRKEVLKRNPKRGRSKAKVLESLKPVRTTS